MTQQSYFAAYSWWCMEPLFCLFLCNNENLLLSCFFQLSLLPCLQQIQKLIGRVRKDQHLYCLSIILQKYGLSLGITCLVEMSHNISSVMWTWVYFIFWNYFDYFRLDWNDSTRKATLLCSADNLYTSTTYTFFSHGWLAVTLIIVVYKVSVHQAGRQIFRRCGMAPGAAHEIQNVI